MPPRQPKIPQDGLPFEDLPPAGDVIVEPEESVDSERRVFDPEQMRAFGRVPALMRVHTGAEPTGELARPAAEEAEPRLLSRTVFETTGDYIVDGAVLSKEEFTKITLSVGRFLERNQAKIEKRTAKANAVRREELLITEQRDLIKELLENHTGVIWGLHAEQLDMEEVTRKAHAAGRAWTREADLLVLSGTALHSFERLVNLVAHRKNWTPEQLAAVQQAVAYRLFEGPQSERMAYWGQLALLCKRYAARKEKVFQRRVNELTPRLAVYEQKAKDFYAKNPFYPI